MPNFAFNRRWDTATLILILFTSLIRLPLLSAVELSFDEAYYWDWSRRLSLGYYDQGPLVAYVIRITTMIFGINEFGVRFGVWLASAGTVLCMAILARRIYSPFTAFLSTLTFACTPLVAIGSLIATYDPIQVFFWSAALLTLERALFGEKRSLQNRAWMFTGVLTGFGFLSKHTMLFIIPCLFFFFAVSPSHRVWLRRPQPYLAFLIVLVMYGGVIYWNSQNHWWNFGHLLFLTKQQVGTPTQRVGNLLGGQVLFLGPVLFLASLMASWIALRQQGQTAGVLRSRFLASMGLPLILLFCLMGLTSKVQANWPLPAWLTLVVLWCGWMTNLMGKTRTSSRKAVASVVASTGFALFLTVGLFYPPLRLAIGIRLAPKNDQSNKLFGWKALAERVNVLREEAKREGKEVFIAGNGYHFCAMLAFYLPDHPDTHDLILRNRLTMYAAYIEALKSKIGQDAIFVDDTRNDAPNLEQVFEKVEWFEPYPLWRRPTYTEPIWNIHIAKCRNFNRYVGLDWAEGGFKPKQSNGAE